ncbi:MAG: PAS domain S-box protein [Candidatus Hodarchaeota archaeon]
MLGENLYKLGLESLNFPFFIIDVQDYKIIYANSFAELIYGECDPVKTCFELTHKRNTPCTGKEHPCPLKKVKNAKKSVIEKHIHYNQSGESFNFEIHCHPVFDDKGDVVQVIEYSLDTTKYEKLEKKQTRLLNYVSDAVISTDLNFSIIDWNKAAEHIYGWRKEEVLGKTVDEITQIEYPYDKSEDVINKFMKDGIWYGEVIQRRKDGTPLNILVSVALVKDETGSPKTALAVNRDITKRVQAEEELRQRTYELKERVKELSCLYEISRLLRGTHLSLKEIFLSIVKIIPSTWQYPRITCSRIIYQQETYESVNFRLTSWSQKADIINFGKKIGSVEVYYLEEKESKYEGPFLEEERHLIDIIGQEISRFIERQITDDALKSSQEKLNEVNQLFEKIFNTTDTLIANLDPQFNFIWVNRAYAHADEKEPGFFPGKNHFDLYPNKENEEIFKRVIKTGRPHYSIAKPFEYAEHPERGVSHWDWSLIPIKDLNGMISGLVLTIQDVSDRIQMQEALKDSEEKYKNITELSQEIILRFNLEGKCTFINRTGAKFFGKSPEDMLGENILELVHPNDLKKTRSLLKEIKGTRTHIEGFTNLLNVPLGTRAMDWNASPILDKFGEVIEIQATGRDVTELQEELIEKNKLAAVGQLAAGVAHELNTPLANIDLITEYLLSLEDDNTSILKKDVLKNELLDIKKEVKFCGKIVQELLQFSRKIHLSPSKFSLKSLIQELISSAYFETEFSEKGVHIDSKFMEDIELVGDRSLLYQAFQNVLRNSIDSFDECIDRKPNIKINVVKETDKIIINFKDNGIGIKKEDLPKVFEPFFTTKTIGQGTGLGLSIARGIIEKHEGKIMIKSTYGKGTELIVTLPFLSQ